MCGKNEEDERDEEDRRDQEEIQAENDAMENDPYSDDEKDNIGDNGEGNEWKGD